LQPLRRGKLVVIWPVGGKLWAHTVPPRATHCASQCSDHYHRHPGPSFRHGGPILAKGTAKGCRNVPVISSVTSVASAFGVGNVTQANVNKMVPDENRCVVAGLDGVLMFLNSLLRAKLIRSFHRSVANSRTGLKAALGSNCSTPRNSRHFDTVMASPKQTKKGAVQSTLGMIVLFVEFSHRNLRIYMVLGCTHPSGRIVHRSGIETNANTPDRSRSLPLRRSFGSCDRHF
jgi:hypothetical protein